METQIGNITTLIGDPTRTTILWELLDGRAYTAIELAISAETSAQNISMHLAKLVNADLLTVEKQGRHKYYRLSSQEVAYAIEALANLIPKQKQKKITDNDRYSDVKYCRTCYDHLAGKVGVLIADSLTAQGIIELQDKNYNVSRKGRKFFHDFGLELAELQKQRRHFSKPCLDWSERKYHLAGSLGSALLERMLDLDWIRRTKNSRAMVITSLGQNGLRDKFKVEL